MSTPIHLRDYRCEATAVAEGRMVVRGRLTDTRPRGLGVGDGSPLVIHDMTISLTVDPSGFEIVAVDAEMHTNPYDTCPSILADYSQLVGTSIARGYSRRVRELFGGPNGCSHLTALLQALGPVAVQASWSLGSSDVAERAVAAADPTALARRADLNGDTCHVWAEGGEQLVALRSGRARTPMWETERLRQLGLGRGPEPEPPVGEVSDER